MSKGIEQIGITGNSPNALTLNLLEALNILGESNTLIVTDDAVDVVNRGAGWALAGSEAIGGDWFNVSIQGAATLLVYVGDVDTDTDGDIDPDDIDTLYANFGFPSPLASADLDGNGKIDITDFNSLLENFSPIGYATQSSVPEPSSVALFVFGLLVTIGVVVFRNDGCAETRA